MADIKRLYRERGGQAIFLMGIRGVSLVSKFILTLFIARFMGFEDLGLYGLIVSGTFIVPAFTGLGIMYVNSRKAVTQSRSEIIQTLRYYSRFIALIYFVLIGVAACVGYYVGEVWLALAIAGVILFEHINNDFYNLLLNLSKPLAANILHFTRTAIWIFVFMALAFVEPSLRTIEALLCAWILGGFLALVGFFWIVRGWEWKTISPLSSLLSWVKVEFKTSKAMYVHSMVDVLGQYTNHFLVTIFLGLELTGVYVYFSQIISALSNLLRTGVIQTARPKLVRAHKALDASFTLLYKACMKHTVLIATIMAVVSIPAMYFVTAHIVDKPLALEWFPIFAVNLLFFIVLMATEVKQLVLYSHHRDDLTLKLSVLYTAGLLMLNMVFIPFLSLWGAVMALLIMISIKLFAQGQFVKQLFKSDKADAFLEGGGAEENKYHFFRNDQKHEFFEFDPKDPTCLDAVGFKYFGRVLHELEPEIQKKGLVFYVTAWTVHELPSYGPNVVVCILQDEWSREPKYRNKVGMVFRTCGKFPIVSQVYRYGGGQDVVSNFLGQLKFLMRDGTGRLKTLMFRILRQKIAPVYNIPLGYYCHDDVPYKPMEERTNDLYFAGSINHMERTGVSIRRPKELARDRMSRHLKKMQIDHPNTSLESTITKEFSESITTNNKAYLENTMNAKICPIPRGANLETFRFYEAIRYGCIPVGEVFPKGYFYDDAPIIRLNNWADLEKEILPLLQDSQKLNELHSKVLKWWDDVCSEKATANYMFKKIDGDRYGD